MNNVTSTTDVDISSLSTNVEKEESSTLAANGGANIGVKKEEEGDTVTTSTTATPGTSTPSKSERGAVGGADVDDINGVGDSFQSDDGEITFNPKSRR
jgi:hypothetical protein